MTLKGIIIRLKRIIRYPYYKLMFGNYCFNDSVESTSHITTRCVYLQKKVYIGYNARIQGIRRYNMTEFNPSIVFKSGASVQQNGHITCAQYIEIGENTAIGANVTITDIHHPYDDVQTPIERQDIEVNPVYVGDDCKIYNNVVILPGTRIGKHCTIGANSVVTGIIPDFSVAVGAPARVVKRFDFEQNIWKTV